MHSFTGKDRVEFMEKMVPSDLQNLPPSMGALSIITNENGGIIDDCIVTNRGDDLYTVINAGHEDKDLPHFEKHLKAFTAGGKDVQMEPLTGNGLLALQGPKAVSVMCALARARALWRMCEVPRVSVAIVTAAVCVAVDASGGAGSQHGSHCAGSRPGAWRGATRPRIRPCARTAAHPRTRARAPPCCAPLLCTRAAGRRCATTSSRR